MTMGRVLVLIQVGSLRSPKPSTRPCAMQSNKTNERTQHTRGPRQVEERNLVGKGATDGKGNLDAKCNELPKRSVATPRGASSRTCYGSPLLRLPHYACVFRFYVLLFGILAMVSLLTLPIRLPFVRQVKSSKSKSFLSSIPILHSTSSCQMSEIKY